MIPIQHIHPMLVHFPIVIVLLLAGFDTIAVLSGKNILGRTTIGNISLTLAVLAAISAVAAYVFGGMALSVAESTGFHSDVAEIHETLGSSVAITTGIYAILRVFLWWRKTRVSGLLCFAFPVVAISCSALVATTAYFGGQLVYELGVNVAKIALN